MKRKFIFHRLFIVAVALAAGILATLVCFFFILKTGELSVAPVIILIVLFAGYIYWVYKFVIIPYKNVEKTLNLFASGYTIEDIFLQKYSISPEIDKVLQRLDEYLSTDQALEANRNQAQYLALQNQINPHFLYNALEGIRGEAFSQGQTNIANITEALGTFFRYTISNVDREVTIADELESVKNYFFIQKYRFEDKLSLEVLVEDEEEIRTLCMPKLVLQPIVENVVIHGIEPKTGNGRVTIAITIGNSWVNIVVSDNGVGIEETTLQGIKETLEKTSILSENKSSHGGIALVNVNNRIKLLYGEEYGIEIYSSVGIGTDVEINLPIVTHKGDHKYDH